jgi:hypothetical protein
MKTTKIERQKKTRKSEERKKERKESVESMREDGAGLA